MSEHPTPLLSKLTRHFSDHGVRGTATRALDHAGFLVERWREARLDQRFGAETVVRVSPEHLDDGLVSQLGGYGYQGVSEGRFAHILRTLHQHLPDTSDHAFFDVGAGKGRAMMLAAAHGPWRRVAGVELSAELVAAAQRNFEAFRARFPTAAPLHLAQGNALDVALPHGPVVLFLYNPFGAEVLRAFLQRLQAHHRQQGPDLWLAYCNPLHQQVLRDAGLDTWLKPVAEHAEWVLYHARVV